MVRCDSWCVSQEIAVFAMRTDFGVDKWFISETVLLLDVCCWAPLFSGNNSCRYSPVIRCLLSNLKTSDFKTF